MDQIASTYGIPEEVMDFVRKGLLEVIEEKVGEATVEFLIPSLSKTEGSDHYTFYTLVWIHPDRNAEFCHYYLEKPGDLPNFYVRIDTDKGDDRVEDLDALDDLIDWLSSQQETASSVD